MNNSVRGVKTPGPVILYMLNLRKGSEFEAKFNGERLTGHSGENELALFEEPAPAPKSTELLPVFFSDNL